MPESILEEAQEIIFGARNASYGHPRDNFQKIADLWNGYLAEYNTEISTTDVANLMILVKVARINGNGYHRDSVVDIAGYAGTIERLQEPDPDDAMPLADWEKELLGINIDPCLPRQFRYLNHEVPSDVQVVRDTEGWIWRRNTEFDTWHCDNEDKHITDVWSGFFTEVRVVRVSG